MTNQEKLMMQLQKVNQELEYWRSTLAQLEHWYERVLDLYGEGQIESLVKPGHYYTSNKNKCVRHITSLQKKHGILCKKLERMNYGM